MENPLVGTSSIFRNCFRLQSTSCFRFREADKNSLLISLYANQTSSRPDPLPPSYPGILRHTGAPDV